MVGKGRLEERTLVRARRLVAPVLECCRLETHPFGFDDAALDRTAQ
jgi:hypothetical protein